MPRCCRFFVSPRREEGAYPTWSVTDEQHRRGEKAARPRGRERLGLSGSVAHSSQVALDMLVARALPFSPKRSRVVSLSYFNRLLNGQYALAGHRCLYFRCRRRIDQRVTARRA